MTTDLQRMHQDEWLADLLSTEDERGTMSIAMVTTPHCALGRAVASGAPQMIIGKRPRSNLHCYSEQTEAAYVFVREWLGISRDCGEAVWMKSDTGHSFDEIATWFKAERDAHNGDLSEWLPS